MIIVTNAVVHTIHHNASLLKWVYDRSGMPDPILMRAKPNNSVLCAILVMDSRQYAQSVTPTPDTAVGTTPDKNPIQGICRL